MKPSHEWLIALVWLVFSIAAIWMVLFVECKVDGVESAPLDCNGFGAVAVNE